MAKFLTLLLTSFKFQNLYDDLVQNFAADLTLKNFTHAQLNSAMKCAHNMLLSVVEKISSDPEKMTENFEKLGEIQGLN